MSSITLPGLSYSNTMPEFVGALVGTFHLDKTINRINDIASKTGISSHDVGSFFYRMSTYGGFEGISSETLLSTVEYIAASTLKHFPPESALSSDRPFVLDYSEGHLDLLRAIDRGEDSYTNYPIASIVVREPVAEPENGVEAFDVYQSRISEIDAALGRPGDPISSVQHPKPVRPPVAQLPKSAQRSLSPVRTTAASKVPPEPIAVSIATWPTRETRSIIERDRQGNITQVMSAPIQY